MDARISIEALGLRASGLSRHPAAPTLDPTSALIAWGSSAVALRAGAIGGELVSLEVLLHVPATQVGAVLPAIHASWSL